MTNLIIKPRIDSWILATWDEYMQQLNDSLDQQTKGYYYQGHMRIEMPPVSFDHGQNRNISKSEG